MPMGGTGSGQPSVPESGATEDIADHDDPYSIDGLRPDATVAPTDDEELSTALAEAASNDLAVSPRGGGTQVDIGNTPGRLDRVLDLSRLDSLVRYSPADLTATVQAGMTVAALQRRLAEHGQFLAIDPPLPDRATVGGALAVGASGPTKWQFGNPRDTVIGMKVAQADGTFVHSGGQVVKNVSGYDMARLHVGGLGTLGVIAEVSFKLTPLPQSEATLVAVFDSRESCFQAGLTIFHSDVIPLGLTAYDAEADDKADVAPVKGAHLLAVRLGGRPRSLQRSLRECRSLCHVRGATSVEVLDHADAPSVWRKLADFGWDEATTPLLSARASVLPTALGGMVEAVAAQAASQDARFASVCHLGYGTALLFWFASGPGPATGALTGLANGAREAAHAASGRMTVQRCPPEVKSTLDVWDEIGESLAIMQRLKEQYDPGNVLNPGRFVGGI